MEQWMYSYMLGASPFSDSILPPLLPERLCL